MNVKAVYLDDNFADMLAGSHVSESGLDFSLFEGAVCEWSDGSTLNTGEEQVLQPL